MNKYVNKQFNRPLPDVVQQISNVKQASQQSCHRPIIAVTVSSLLQVESHVLTSHNVEKIQPPPHHITNILRPFFRDHGGRWRWALVSPDGVAPRRMVSVSASVNLCLHHKVQ